MAAPLQRHPFDATRAAAVAEFVSRCTKGAMEPDWVVMVVTTVVSEPEAVCELWRGGSRCAVGVAIDALETEGNAAELSIFTEPAGDAEATAALIEWGQERAKKVGRDRLDIPEWPGIGLALSVLEEHGFYPGHVMYKMSRKAKAAAPEPRLSLPAQWRWTVATTEHLADYHETVRLAFVGIPGAFVPPLATFATMFESLAHRPLLLLSTDADTPVAGFVRVTHRADGTGELSSLGRHPRYRGLGLGEHIVASGLDKLRELGAGDVGLEVAAANESGLTLYQSFDFEVTESMTVYHLSLHEPR